jgi:hypothetical protein
VSDYHRTWRKEHRASVNRTKAKWLKTANGKRWLKRYRQRYNAAHKNELAANAKRDRDKLKLETLLAYGRVCACCGESEPAFLTLDHVAGDGAEQRRVQGHKGGTAQYRLLRKSGFPPGYRVLCWNCNCAIAITGVCPHQKVVTDDKPLKPGAERIFFVER